MLTVLLGAVALLWTAPVLAGDPAAQCESVKNKETGKLANCLQKAHAKLVQTAGTCSVSAGECYRDDQCPGTETCQKDTTKHDATVFQCEEKFSAKWTRAEDNGGAECPTEW